MYQIPDLNHEQLFQREAEIVIDILGQTTTDCKQYHLFNSVVKDSTNPDIAIKAYTGKYFLDLSDFVIQKLSLIQNTLISDDLGLQLLASGATVERFIKLAKTNHCRKLLVYTTDSIIAESLFIHKFNMVKLNNDTYEVRAELTI